MHGGALHVVGLSATHLLALIRPYPYQCIKHMPPFSLKNTCTTQVFDEPPCYHQSRHFHKVFAGRYGELEQDYNVLPPTGSFSEFVEGIVGAYKMCIDTVHHIGSGNFALKWYVGRARPEVSASAS